MKLTDSEVLDWLEKDDDLEMVDYLRKKEGQSLREYVSTQIEEEQKPKPIVIQAGCATMKVNVQ